MSGTTLDLFNLLTPDMTAVEIAKKWQEWHSNRRGWLNEKMELRNYLYATDTKTTSNNKLPWSNSTTTPKLTQIYDNLKANYTAAIFPNDHWMKWEGDNKDANEEQKVQVIQSYMENKLRQSKFETAISNIIDDFILYGNCFATTEFVNEFTKLPDGSTISTYTGPKIKRISPYDIVFDPTSSDFKRSPKIVRSILTLGEIEKMSKNGHPEMAKVFDKMVYNRQQVGSAANLEKTDGFIADGFSDIQLYYGSGYAEILTFYGDIYDIVTKELRTHRILTIVDRAYVLSDEAFPSWLGDDPIFMAGWRARPDNLWAMGPLDNLVGMQYRIDHLENLKADVFDQIAYPIQKIKGDVQDYDFEPGSRIYLGDEGDVGYLVPDTTALNADTQINILEQKMEEMAGAPKQAMGIRTPGEKTAFEVQTLQNNAGRIFQHKAEVFEREFLEPVLNSMLESARRNMNTADTIRMMDDKSGATLFAEITRDDIAAKGTIRPVGARHFAERALRVQNISQLVQLMANPQIGAHLSGKTIAKILADELGEPELYGDNIAIHEQSQTQSAAQNAQADNQEQLAIKQRNGM